MEIKIIIEGQSDCNGHTIITSEQSRRVYDSLPRKKKKKKKKHQMKLAKEYGENLKTYIETLRNKNN